ncbi:MAG: hypothetical protein P4M13_09675 [Alphaproteobacteria bacterium]|nr:hypothetical protein [Alphaproteobacteria bacterium]
MIKKNEKSDWNLVPQDGEDHLSKVSENKREELVAAYIVAAKEFNHLFYAKDKQRVYENLVVKGAVEAVNSHLLELSWLELKVFLVFNPHGKETLERKIFAFSKPEDPDDLANALLAGYRTLTKACPKTIREALDLAPKLIQ